MSGVYSEIYTPDFFFFAAAFICATAAATASLELVGSAKTARASAKSFSSCDTFSLPNFASSAFRCCCCFYFLASLASVAPPAS